MWRIFLKEKPGIEIIVIREEKGESLKCIMKYSKLFT